MGGKTLEAFSGSAMVLPSAMLARVRITASSTTLFPAVRAVISRPSRMATPLEMRVPSVRVNLATATLRMSSPKTGAFKSSESITLRPLGVL